MQIGQVTLQETHGVISFGRDSKFCKDRHRKKEGLHLLGNSLEYLFFPFIHQLANNGDLEYETIGAFRKYMKIMD